MRRHVQRQRLFRTVDRDIRVDAGQDHAQPTTTGALARAIVRAIIQQVSHRVRRIRKKLRGMFEAELTMGVDAQVQFVHQRGGVERIFRRGRGQFAVASWL